LPAIRRLFFVVNDCSRINLSAAVSGMRTTETLPAPIGAACRRCRSRVGGCRYDSPSRADRPHTFIDFYPYCAYRKSSPSILVMQSIQDRTAQNAPRCLLGT
jgi:hypothetical protein